MDIHLGPSTVIALPGLFRPQDSIGAEKLYEDVSERIG
jgi:hypothetical protein